jgi:dihydroorotase
MRPNSWHPLFPRSHYYARPPEAEIESVRGQINFASDAKFEGTLYIAHVSVPESVELIDKARQDRMKIRCGVTPHHCLLYEQKIPQAKKGLLYKVNPPLRNKEAAKKMLALLREGKIDWIETDHAPHTLKEKLNEPYMSGFPGLPFYPHFIYYLKKDGFSEELLWKITHHNIEDIFKMGIRPLEWNSSKSPDLNLHTEYEVDVYKDVRQK